MIDEHMLTTVDNPYNPFTKFDEWHAYDVAHGYHSLSLLARVFISSSELSDPDQSLATERAIEEVVRENVSGMHRMISADGTPFVGSIELEVA